MSNAYDCAQCGKHHDRIEMESCTLTGDSLFVQDAGVVQFDSSYDGDGFMFCDIECFGEWLGPRIHRLFEAAP